MQHSLSVVVIVNQGLQKIQRHLPFEFSVVVDLLYTCKQIIIDRKCGKRQNVMFFFKYLFIHIFKYFYRKSTLSDEKFADFLCSWTSLTYLNSNLKF